MADTKISALTTLTTLAAGDYFPVVDVSDTSMAASGTTKKVAADNVAPLTSNWTPVVADASAGGNVATGTFGGTWTKNGNQVTLWGWLLNITTTGMTGANVLYVRGFPYAVRTLTNYVAIGSVKVSRMTFSSYVIANANSGESHLTFFEFTTGNNLEAPLTVSDVAGSGFTDLYFTLTYQTT